VPGIPTGAVVVVDGAEDVGVEAGVGAEVEVDGGVAVGVGDAGGVVVPAGVEAVGVGVAVAVGVAVGVGVAVAPVSDPVVRDFTGERLCQRSWNLYATKYV
jgi:hypothetical protein